MIISKLLELRKGIGKKSEVDRKAHVIYKVIEKAIPNLPFPLFFSCDD
jgi:hypothetical protein